MFLLRLILWRRELSSSRPKNRCRKNIVPETRASIQKFPRLRLFFSPSNRDFTPTTSSFFELPACNEDSFYSFLQHASCSVFQGESLRSIFPIFQLHPERATRRSRWPAATAAKVCPQGTKASQHPYYIHWTLQKLYRVVLFECFLTLMNPGSEIRRRGPRIVAQGRRYARQSRFHNIRTKRP